MRSSIVILAALSWLICGLTGCQALQNTASSFKEGFRTADERVDPDEVLDPLGARDPRRLLLDDLTPNQLATTLKTKFNGQGDQETARRHFDTGKRLYDEATRLLAAGNDDSRAQEMFVDAANEFRLASASWSDSELDEEAAFFEGESYFFADRYVQANRAFERLIADYSGTKYLDMAENRRYAIAVYWLKLSESDSFISLTDPKRPKFNPAAEARRVLQRIRIDDPTGKLADDATLALGKAFLKAENYYEAADAFEDLRQNYPGSKHQFMAHLLELEAHLSGYQGANYDDSPLRKAEKLLKTIVEQFPNQIEQDRAYLEKQGSLIRGHIAQRDYSIGQYFENRGENRAAEFYYAKVAEKFQGTELGQAVEQQVAAVKQKPAKPKQHLAWLVNMFPDPKSDKPIIESNTGTLLR